MALLAVGMVLGAGLARMPVRDPGALAGMRARTPMRPGGNSFLNQFFFNSLSWCACAVSAPLFLWIARRYPFSRSRWIIAVAVNAIAFAGMVAMVSATYYLLNRPGGDFPVPFLVFARSRVFSDALPFLAMIAAIHAFEYRRRERERADEAIRLTTLLTSSRLDALSAQLQPHFLFNTLQGISTLMHRDVQAADTMLSQLSDLLRRSLSRDDGRHEIPLEEELALMHDYVDISRQRFGDRLQFRTEVDPATAGALVPFFLLQPLVENAFEHGIARHRGAGSVSVRVDRTGPNLRLEISNDGSSLTGIREGVGLTNTRSRLRALYGDDQSLVLAEREGAGVCVSVTLPFRVPAT